MVWKGQVSTGTCTGSQPRTCDRDRRVTDRHGATDMIPDFGSSTCARGPISIAQACKKERTAAPDPQLDDPAATRHSNMRNGRAPAAQRWLQPQSHASAATHMHTLQKSASTPLPPNKASLCPLCPPLPTLDRSARPQSPDSACRGSAP